MLNNNSYFAHGENFLVAMLSDQDQHAGKKAIEIVLYLKRNPVTFTDKQYSDDTANDYFAESIAENDEDRNKACANEYSVADINVQVFRKPMMNFKGSTYHNLTNFSHWKITPSVFKSIL